MINLAPVSAPSDRARDANIVNQLKRYRRFGFMTMLIFLGSLMSWSVLASLQGAVATAGQFVVASDVKKVQHPTGGVVGELLVKDGDRVNAGDVVIRLDDTLLRANYQIVAKQLDEFAVRRSRLEAERDGAASIELPAEFLQRENSPELTKLLASEQRLFETRRSAKDGQRSQLRKRVTQLHDEIRGLKAQQAAKEEESRIIAIELKGVEDLYRRNLIQLTRLSALQRDAASLQGQTGQLVAQMAQAEGKIAETELQIIQLDEDQRSEVMKELREIQAKTGELVERRTAAADQLKRVDLRSPNTGVVHQLAVHTVGGVIQAGEPAMLIIPVEDDLQVEARVLPTDIDQITLGQSARAKVLAGQQSTNPELRGTVVRIAADVTRDDKQSPPFYSVRIALPKSEFERMGETKIIAGMQAEVFIETTVRTPLEYLIKPISDHLGRTFRER